MQREWVRCGARIVLIYFPMNITFKREKQCHMANKPGLSAALRKASIQFLKTALGALVA